jgi:DNA-binding CsgD family transcriptional regulator
VSISSHLSCAEFFAESTACELIVLMPDLTVGYASPEAVTRFTLPEPASDGKGHPLATLVPTNLGHERSQLAAAVLASGLTARLLGFVGGRLSLTTFQRMAWEGDKSSVWVASQAISSVERFTTCKSQQGIRIASHNEMGVLGLLSIRQIEVLRMIGLGATGPQIARAMHRSTKTIEFHRESAKSKLGLDSVSDLVRVAISSGLVYIDEPGLSHWWPRR